MTPRLIRVLQKTIDLELQDPLSKVKLKDVREVSERQKAGHLWRSLFSRVSPSMKGSEHTHSGGEDQL